MTSERKISANRLNATKSRGPKSVAAKARVSHNALRHGLAALKHFDAALPRDIELMAKAICAGDTNPLLFEQALVIAENEMVLRCVRAQRLAVIERLRDLKTIPLTKGDNCAELVKARWDEMDLASDEFDRRKAKFDALPFEEQEKLWDEYEDAPEPKPTPIEERDEIDAMYEAMPDLDRLARYERRAWSRRKRAMRNFTEIKSRSDDEGEAIDGS
jgi:hypothetical protein